MDFGCVRAGAPPKSGSPIVSKEWRHDSCPNMVRRSRRMHASPSGPDRDLARRIVRANRHVGGQSRAEEHRRRFARRCQRNAVGHRLLQSRLCEFAADRRYAGRPLWTQTNIRFGYCPVHCRHVALRTGTKRRNLNWRANRQRHRRGLRSPHVSGAAHACLSGPQSTRTRFGHMGKLQCPRFHYWTHGRRLACRYCRVAKHILRHSARLRGGRGTHLCRHSRERGAERTCARPARANPGHRWSFCICFRRNRRVVLGVGLALDPVDRRHRPDSICALRLGRSPYSGTHAASPVSAPPRIFSSARGRRPHDVWYLRPAVHHAALFPDLARRESAHCWP